ncbi:hypothetical protein ACIQB5_50355 [Streptomyces sp. NPDC088560]
MSEIRALHAEHEGACGGLRASMLNCVRGGRRTNRERVTRLMRINHIVG